MLERIDRARHTISFVSHSAEPDSFALTALAQWLDTSPGGMATTAEGGRGMESGTEGTTPSNPVQRLAAHIRDQLGAGPFSQADGWTHMGAVISDASFQARSRYKATILPRILALQTAWPDAATVKGFQARLATDDLATAMNFHHARKVAKAHNITDLLAVHGVDTRDDLRAWLDIQPNRAALRAVKDVGPKTVDYLGNLVGGSQIAVDVHLRAFAAEAGVTDLRYEQLRTTYEHAAALLGHEPGGMEHAVWRLTAGVS
ncbi:hypothetical protein AB0L54_29300 [Streptomyces sp. NPDC052196]|uniref:hypothetical protein n=1 Tax=Streptomyces sp. NPDC052196 TaxID=3156691 RepID=UPI0034257FCE